VVHCRLFREGKLVEEGFDPGKVSDHLEDETNLVWLDLEDPSEVELALIEEEFSLHPLAIEDARHRDQRPKLDFYEGYSFLVMYGVEVDNGRLREREVHAFAGAHYLITIRYRPALDLDPVVERIERHDDLLREGGGFPLYALLDDVVDGYFDVVDRLEAESEDLEEMVFGENPPADVQERIFRLKKRVIGFRRRVGPLREVLVQLQGVQSLVTAPLAAYYRDVADHVTRALELIDILRDLLTGALEAHLARTGNRLNEVMKALTSWGAIILVPTLIAGIYGMNFERAVPGWDWAPGFWVALGLMILSAVALYVMFKRRDWL
jgi:magnesium transporter